MNKMMRVVLAALAMFLCASVAHAAVKSERVDGLPSINNVESIKVFNPFGAVKVVQDASAFGVNIISAGNTHFTSDFKDGQLELNVLSVSEPRSATRTARLSEETAFESAAGRTHAVSVVALALPALALLASASGTQPSRTTVLALAIVAVAALAAPALSEDPSTVDIVIQLPAGVRAETTTLPGHTLVSVVDTTTTEREPAAAQQGQRAGNLTADNIDVPEGAVLEERDNGFALVFEQIATPFEAVFALPEGANMVRSVVQGDPAVSYGLRLSSALTGRRRCNTQPLLSYDEPIRGFQTCSGIALVDRPGDEWRVRVTGGSSAFLEIQLISDEIDGIAGGIDYSQISKMDQGYDRTEYLKVPSFDGTELRVEVSYPEGEGPWPVILSVSPYNNDYRAQVDDGTERPAMLDYWTEDWVRRGYVGINADVRGYGESKGCIEVFGPNEQFDSVFLVEWAAKQPWSTGKVGFYGQSYLGTTAAAASVHAPDALKAIISIAPVIDPFKDWHYGGVPNLEAAASPLVAYQGLYGTAAVVRPFDPLETAANVAAGVCDPALTARANDPRAIRDLFYQERDLGVRAGTVRAATLYTQGFEDANVKSAMIPDWFNDISAPKLGLFGHWLHQHPPRMDEEALFLGWLDQYVKGKPVGLDSAPSVDVQVTRELHRTADQWPQENFAGDREELQLYTDFASAALVEADTAPASSAAVTLDPILGTLLPGSFVELEYTVAETFAFAGATVDIVGSVLGPNAYLAATLTQVLPSGFERQLTFGQFNVAHRFGDYRFDAATPLDAIEGQIEMMPTEHIVEAGSTLRLQLRGVATIDNLYPVGYTGQFTFEGATRLNLWQVPMSEYVPTGYSAAP